MYFNNQLKKSSNIQSLSMDKMTLDDVDEKIQLRNHALKRTSDSSHGIWIPEENFVDLEFRRTSYRKARRTVTKVPVKKGKMPTIMEMRRSSSRFAAKMTGLDPLPPSLLKQLKERGPNHPETASVGFYHKHRVMEKQKQNKIDFPDVEIDGEVLEKKLFDDELEYMKECNDILQDLDSVGDHIPKPTSRFGKYLQYLKCGSPSPRAHHITILKPSNTSLLPHKLPEYAPTVVLNQSSKNVSDMTTTGPLGRSHESFQYEHRLPISKRSEVYVKMRDTYRQSREIAREVVRKLRSTGGSSSTMVLPSEKHGYISAEGPCGKSVNVKSEVFQRTSNYFDDCGDIHSSSSYYSIDSSSSLSGETGGCVSEQSKMSRKLQEVELSDRGSSTLVYDKEISGTSRSASQCDSRKKVDGNELLARWGLRINNKKSWKDVSSRNLTWSKSPPDSSLGCGNYSGERDTVSWTISSFQSLKSCYKEDEFYSDREEGELSEREIHLNPEELLNRHDEKIFMVSERSNFNAAGRRFEGGNLPPQSKDGNFFLIIDSHQVQQSKNGGESSSTNLKGVERKEFSIDHPQIPSHGDISESIAPGSSIESDRSSLLFGLGLAPSEEDKPSSECSDKFGADPKELKLLKCESADIDNELFELPVYNDEDIGQSHILGPFRNDEDRDFQYLLDVLVESRVYLTNDDEVFNSCFLREYSVEPKVFEMIENKYNALVSWPKAERKLLFDLINSNLATLSADRQSTNSKKRNSIWALEDRVDDVWQMVYQQRTEMSRKPKVKLMAKWLDVGDDVKMLGCEVEGFLFEDLIEELVAQFQMMTYVNKHQKLS